MNPLKPRLMIKPIYDYLCQTMDQEKLIMTFRSSFFVLINYQIVTLTYDHSYLRLFILNNGRRRIIYNNHKLFFRRDKLHNDTLVPNKFTSTAVIPNRTTSKNEYFISDVHFKFILKYSSPPLGTCTKTISLEKYFNAILLE